MRHTLDSLRAALRVRGDARARDRRKTQGQRHSVGRRPLHALLAGVTGLAMTGALVAVGGPAIADDGPQSFGMSMVPGSAHLMIKNNEPGAELGSPGSLNGDYDAATGAITGATLSSSPVTFVQHVTEPITTDVTITEQLIQSSAGSGVGTFDSAGNMTYDATFKLHVHIKTIVEGDCFSEPINIKLKSTAPYDPATKQVKLSASGFNIPNLGVTSDCSSLIVSNAGAQFAGSDNRLDLTLQGNLAAPLASSSTSLTVTPDSPVTTGTASTLTATVTPADATGSVKFYSGGNSVGNAELVDGVATLSAKLGTGDQQLRAEYVGNETYAPSESDSVPYKVQGVPTLSADWPQVIQPGAAPAPFKMTLANPASGADVSLQVYLGVFQTPVAAVGKPGYGINIDADMLHLEYQDDAGTWQQFPLSGNVTSTGSMLTATLGLPNGVAVPAGTSRDIPFRMSVDADAPSKTLSYYTQLKTVDPDTGEYISLIAAGQTNNATVVTPTARIAPASVTVANGIDGSSIVRGYDVSFGGTVLPPADVEGQAPYTKADGTAQFLLDGEPIAVGGSITRKVSNNSVATGVFHTDGLSTGQHTLVLQYLGGTNYSRALSAPVTFTVTPGYGKPYDCTYALLGNPQKTRVLVSATADLPAAVLSGTSTAVRNVDVTVGGPTAYFLAGSTDFSGALAPSGSVQIAAGTKDTSHGDARIEFTGGSGTATVTGDPGESVDVSLGEFTFVSHIGGFFGDALMNCAPANGAESLGPVAAVGNTLTVSPDGGSSRGQAVTLTASVLPSASMSGTVTFFDGEKELGEVALVGGKAVLKTSDLAPGDHELYEVWSGTLTIPTNTSNSVMYQVAGDTTMSLTSSKSPSQVGEAVTFTAAVGYEGGGTASGTVQFKADGANLGDPVTLSGGKATLTTGTLALGDHSVVAEFTGSSETKTSAPLTQTVTQATTTLTAAPASVSATGLSRSIADMKATLTGPGGPIAGKTITFKVGAAKPCTVKTDSNGVATCSGAKVSVLQLLLNQTYTVSFAGDATATAATAKGQFTS